jgi:hypothetical protein
VKNVRGSVRQILSVLNCSSRGKKRQHDEPRSGAGSHSLLPPQHHRMACGDGPEPPLPLRHQSARPRGQRAPFRQAHHDHYSLVEARLLPAGVRVNRPRICRQRQVAPLLHPGRLKNRGGRRIGMTDSRPRKTSGSPRGCGARHDHNMLIISHPFYFHLRLCIHYFFSRHCY